MTDIGYLIEWQQSDPSNRHFEVKTVINSTSITVFVYDFSVMIGKHIQIGDPIPDFTAIKETRDRAEYERLSKQFKESE